MSALDDLLAEVRIEAEVAVRTEYENEVTRLRTLAAELEKEVQHLEAIVDDMDGRYNDLHAKLADFESLVRTALDVL